MIKSFYQDVWEGGSQSGSCGLESGTCKGNASVSSSDLIAVPHVCPTPIPLS